MKTLTDKYGNVLQYDNGVISLRLRGENRVRVLGHWEKKENRFVTYRKSSHTHRMLTAIGFNYQLIHHGTFHDVVVETDFLGTLTTTRETIKQMGSVKQFRKKQGFELQVFLPITLFSHKGKQHETEGHNLDAPPGEGKAVSESASATREEGGFKEAPEGGVGITVT